MKKAISVFLLISLVLAVVGCGNSSQPTVSDASGQAQTNSEVYSIKLAHVGDSSHHYQLGGQKFKELVEERSNGRIKVDLYANGELGDERSILEGMQLGSIEMGIITTGPLSGFVPEFAIVDLGYLFNSKEEAKQILHGEIGQAFSQKMLEVGIRNLGDVSCGFRNVYSKRTITSIGDLNGMTIRTMENPSHMACFQALGAKPVPMAYGELYTALQQGAVDGAENVPDMYLNSKHYEVAPEMAMTEHIYLVVMWMVSESFYKNLPADLQQIVQECSQEAIVFEEQAYAEKEQEVLNTLKEGGVTFYTVDKDAFRAAAMNSWDEQAEKISGGVENLAIIKQMLGI